MELELIHLAGYLPYGLKFMPTQYNKEENKLYYLSSIYNSAEFGVNGFTSKWIKPIFRPLSDLTKEIEVNGEKFVPMKKLLKEVGFNYPLDCYIQDEQWILNDRYRAIGEFPHRKVNMLLEWHFDIYGLIEKGLAIDINILT